MADVESLTPPPLDLLGGAALFLDFDGTLVELVDKPDLVRADARLQALVHRLSLALDGRVAIISGRDVAFIRAMFGDVELAVAGSHGLEIAWPDGRMIVPERPEGLDRITAEMHRFATATPGVLVEEKPFGAALHYRAVPDAHAAAHALADALATAERLHVQPGKMMVEIRIPGADKGTALRQLMEAPQLVGRAPIFLGDDATDEPAMAVAAEMGGAGVLVGAPRATAARYRLPDVMATLDWLGQAAGGAA